MADLHALKFNEGFVEGWIEHGVKQRRPGADRIREAWKTYIDGFDELYRRMIQAEAKLARIQEILGATATSA